MTGKVLVVDDDLSLRHILVFHLGKLGWKSDSAASGKEAIEHVKLWEYRLILMDINMPDMDGYETTKCIRLIEQQLGREPVPIIASTAGDLDKNKCLAAGMNDCIAKLSLTEGLEDVVCKWIKPDVKETGDTD